MPASAAFPDCSSFSNVGQVQTSHIHWEGSLDFDAQVITAVVQHSMTVVAEAENVTVDTRDLAISEATVKSEGKEAVSVSFSTGTSTAALGTQVVFELPAEFRAVGTKFVLSIKYTTSPSASGVQWLPKEQTAGKEYPYLFTQFEAIHARSMIPCQDTPSVKSTYSAAVTVPSPLRALMSAVADGEPENLGATTVYRFKQAVSVPTYLIALAVGQLVSREIGPRSAVWSEPSMVDAAAHEFADTDRFLTIGEELFGPYVWGRYDILCLPPSFPFGGMENPCLTFVTPTLLAGDRSLADVVCHEIAHSWTGNFVTSQSWEHFWLNEGFTMYLQRSIMKRINGEAFFEFDAEIGYKALLDELEHYGASHAFTALVPVLNGADPDDSFSSVPYEKGFSFLFYLAKYIVKSQDRFEKFLKHYIQVNAYKSIDSDVFKACFLDFFSDVDTSAIDWNAWLYSTGPLPCSLEYDQTMRHACTKLADQWLAGGAEVTDATQWQGMVTGERVAFLEILLLRTVSGESKSPLDESVLNKMDSLYNLSATKNAEVRFRWQTLCLRSGKSDIVPQVVQFITSQGRMKFVRPLYRTLFASSFGREVALETFKAHQSFYHPMAQKMIATDLKLREASA